MNGFSLSVRNLLKIPFMSDIEFVFSFGRWWFHVELSSSLKRIMSRRDPLLWSRRLVVCVVAVGAWFSPRQVSLSVHLCLKGFGIDCHKALLRGVVEVFYNVIVGLGLGFWSFRYYTSRVGVKFHGRESRELGYPEVAGLTTMMAVLGGALSFLLVFRLNWSYSKWWEARGAIGAVYAKSKSLMITFVVSEERTPEQRAVVDRAKVVMKLYTAALTYELAEEVEPTPLGEKKKNNLKDLWCSKLTSLERKVIGEADLDNFLETPYRVFLAHAWISRSVNEAFYSQRVFESNNFIAQHQLADLMELYHKLVKIKETKMPGVIRFLVSLLKSTFCLVLYPQFLAYAFVMKLTDVQRQENALARSSLYPVMYVVITTIGIIYFVTMHVIARDLDDPFGDDLSDFPLTTWTLHLWNDLDHVRHIHQRHQKQKIIQEDIAIEPLSPLQYSHIPPTQKKTTPLWAKAPAYEGTPARVVQMSGPPPTTIHNIGPTTTIIGPPPPPPPETSINVEESTTEQQAEAAMMMLASPSLTTTSLNSVPDDDDFLDDEHHHMC